MLNFRQFSVDQNSKYAAIVNSDSFEGFRDELVLGLLTNTGEEIEFKHLGTSTHQSIFNRA